MPRMVAILLSAIPVGMGILAVSPVSGIVPVTVCKENAGGRVVETGATVVVLFAVLLVCAVLIVLIFAFAILISNMFANKMFCGH